MNLIWDGNDLGPIVAKCAFDVPVPATVVGRFKDKPVFIHVEAGVRMVGVIEEAKAFPDPKIRMVRFTLRLIEAGVEKVRSLKMGSGIGLEVKQDTREFVGLTIGKKELAFIHNP